jgi:pentatricopeptide repeat protein
MPRVRASHVPSRRPGLAGGLLAGLRRRPAHAVPRAAGVEGPAAGLQVPALKHLAIPRLPSDQPATGDGGGAAASRHVARAAAVGERPGRSSSSEGAGNGAGHASVDLGAMFLERLSSNGESSSSAAGGRSGAGAGPSRHERHIMRRREQRAGRRGGAGGAASVSSPGSSAESTMLSSSEEEGPFSGGDYEELHQPVSSWRDARRARAAQVRERRVATASAAAARASQDAFLDAFIARLLSPQHAWRDEGGPLGGPARGPSSGAPGRPAAELAADANESLPPAEIEAMAAGAAPKAASDFATLCRRGRVRGALQLLEALVAAGRTDVLPRLGQRHFFDALAAAKAPRAALRFLQLLPAAAADARTYNMALRACAACRDLEAAASVASLMSVRGVSLDAMHRTTLITAATRDLNLTAAFKYYADARAAAAAAPPGTDAARLDGWVHGALVAACAAGIKAAAHDRKEQLVLLERAFGVMDDAASARVHLEAPAWNALLMCAGEGAVQGAWRGRRALGWPSAQPGLSP